MKKHVFYFNLLKIQAMKTMKIWLVMVAVVCAVGVQGQGWMKTYGGAGNQGFSPIGLNLLNNGFLVLSTNLPPESTTVVHVLETDENGTSIFESQIQFDTLQYLFLTGIKYAEDGGYIISAHGATTSSPNSSSDIIIIKIDNQYELEWMKVFDFDMSDYSSGIIPSASGGYYVSGFSDVSGLSSGLLLKIDKYGEKEWEKEFMIPLGIITFIDFIVNSDSSIVFTGAINDFDSPNDQNILVMKLDTSFNLLWQKSYGNPNIIELGISLTKKYGGGYIICGRAEGSNPVAFAIDEDGNEEWFNTYSTNNSQGVLDVIPSIDGNYLLVGYDYTASNDDVLLLKVNEFGEEIWEKVLGTTEHESGYFVFQYPDGSIYVFGYADRGGDESEVLLIKTDANGNLYSSALTGTVHQDPENDCLPDPTEPGLSGWLVQATGTQSFATLTDSLGHFTLPVDTGSYEVTIAPPGPYWEVCNSPTTASITAFYDTLSLDFPAQAIADCPYLTVDISAPFLRRCFDNNYYVHYCNDGTATANAAAVEVTLDPYFTYISSTLPLSSQNGNTLTFDIGDVAVGDCGNFQITAYLDCDSTILGQTHCTAAHITPDSLCLQPDPLWDGSSIEVDASCSGDSIVFTITNVGSEGMPAPLGFIIIEDQIVLMSGDFQLGPGESTMVTAPANGTTLHLEAQQAAAHPSGFASTGATIEGCGGWMSLGFFTQWSFDDDPDPFTDVDCQANVGSFDPNDKQGFPAGFTDEHLIEPGQDIEYLVRFQNTGTDTAFKVTVVDVLPPELDLATVRPGASSHPYTYGVTPEGWLTFTFNNIMLPDSNVNEAASHGFVRFRASQRPGLGWGNVIANTALIYFDFNAPIQTNTYKHRIGQVFPWTLVGTTPPVFHPKTQVRIVPNPLTDSALLIVEGIEPGPLNLVLTDVSGKVLRQQTVNGTGFEFHRGELNPGLYFFKIDRDGERVGSGQLMVR
ncbi:MAG: T9SS type A sorting domain-containing protein [Saprospiraceae bacterium]|nr:T9SS type A sorting domain-containing protein [Saprospiraceae bacterium]MCF8250047.1 T9SS type A sorting domain-containing protein [Saprospiraceae bacterium]MCF8283296.1 T9SS type A sorting domain-containing protein [Bacteroidales bacterium]MCF8311987.1 T9SS type A sorting domain-containing protein [Saprospiraceae bacterium]MCF8440323.1 T9SS type A sorting domain-containing protein [Saprospiraceae bacterium]